MYASKAVPNARKTTNPNSKRFEIMAVQKVVSNRVDSESAMNREDSHHHPRCLLPFQSRPRSHPFEPWSSSNNPVSSSRRCFMIQVLKFEARCPLPDLVLWSGSLYLFPSRSSRVKLSISQVASSIVFDNAKLPTCATSQAPATDADTRTRGLDDSEDDGWWHGEWDEPVEEFWVAAKELSGGVVGPSVTSSPQDRRTSNAASITGHPCRPPDPLPQCSHHSSTSLQRPLAPPICVQSSQRRAAPSGSLNERRG
ncbi:hypothetical protein B0H10DRAFT_1967723 [Mycena sp. CBHHK59/15]|nr:hypothetical protein B0H10DRAFT_1967723 [Mycena sp. CBHHK59/15]